MSISSVLFLTFLSFIQTSSPFSPDVRSVHFLYKQAVNRNAPFGSKLKLIKPRNMRYYILQLRMHQTVSCPVKKWENYVSRSHILSFVDQWLDHQRFILVVKEDALMMLHHRNMRFSWEVLLSQRLKVAASGAYFF